MLFSCSTFWLLIGVFVWGRTSHCVGPEKATDHANERAQTPNPPSTDKPPSLGHSTSLPTRLDASSPRSRRLLDRVAVQRAVRGADTAELRPRIGPPAEREVRARAALKQWDSEAAVSECENFVHALTYALLLQINLVRLVEKTRGGPYDREEFDGERGRLLQKAKLVDRDEFRCRQRLAQLAPHIR